MWKSNQLNTNIFENERIDIEYRIETMKPWLYYNQNYVERFEIKNKCGLALEFI